MIFIRLYGRNDCVREYRALISPASEYSILPKVDAYRLGYPEAARDDPITEPPNLVRGVTFDGFWEGNLITMRAVSVGNLSFNDIDFIAYDLPQAVGFDVVLGKSFLDLSGTQIDYFLKVLRVGRKLTANEVQEI